jgi:hypothetical protein
MIVISLTSSMNDVNKNSIMNEKENNLPFDKVSFMFELEILMSSCPFVDKFIAIFKGQKFRKIVVILETNIH